MAKAGGASPGSFGPASEFDAAETGGVATNAFLRRIHNFALDMGWLPWPMLPKKRWPKIEYGDKRAITLEEHECIVAREHNPERRTFYELCWLLDGSRGDLASLTAEDIDWDMAQVGMLNKGARRLVLAAQLSSIAKTIERLMIRNTQGSQRLNPGACLRRTQRPK